VGKPLHELRTAISSKSKQPAGLRNDESSNTEPALQLHAYSDQVLLVQLEQLTLAAPAAPVLLQQMHEELCAVSEPAGPATAGVPFWMQDGLLVQQLIDGSNGIVGSSCAPAAAPQQSRQPQQAGQAAAGAAVPSGPPAAGAQVEIVPVQEEREQQQQQQAVQQQRGSPAVPVSMRHGILLLPEDASLTLTAAPPTPSLRKVISAAAIKQWFKQQIARVAPRRLVIRPGEAFLLPTERGRAAAAAAGRAGAAAAGAAAATTAAAAAAHHAAAAGLRPAAIDTVVLAAYCLMDFQGLELLAGRMQRVQVPLATAAGGSSGFGGVSASMSQQAAAAQAAAGLLESPSAPRASGGSLVGLTHMITRTDVRAAVHEFIRPLLAAGGPAAATGSPAAAAVLPAGPTRCNVIALAAADGLDLQLSGWSYQYLMAMIYGNLMHHQNNFVPFKASGPARQQHTAFNPNVKFGPSAGQLPYFALTLSSCAIQVRIFNLHGSSCCRC
jgi:hypothetical protein